MSKTRPVGTSASDSAPGVDDGRVAGAHAAVNSKPAGKPIVWILVALGVALIVFLMTKHTMGRAGRGDDGAISAAQTRSEIESSTIPGAQDETPAQMRMAQPTTAPAASQQRAAAQAAAAPPLEQPVQGSAAPPLGNQGQGAEAGGQR